MNVRDLFPVTRNLIYFNHAAVGAMSTRVYEAMERHARDQRDYGALHWREWYREQDAARSAAARLIGCGDGEIAILKNTSEGLAFVAEGVRWREGDNVVTTALEFPSNMTPWRNLARRGVEVRVASQPSVDAIAPLVDGRTRVVTVSWVAFHDGTTADLDALGAFCAESGVLFCVDAIQGLGALPIDVKRSKISFLAADGHKWLCGPEGAAVFYVDEARLDELDVLEYGWTNVVRRGATFLDAPANPVPGARRFEAGSLNTNGAYALHASLELALEIGIDRIAADVIRVATHLADGMEAAGFVVRSPRPIASGIIGVAIDDPRELMRLHGALEKEGIVCAPREGMLRFSPHYYNTVEEADQVVDVLARLRAGATTGARPG